MASSTPLPASISRYKILKRIGEGGMGSLFLARDPEMDRLLAIKLLREDVESDELRERFKREARANARLNHQNIVIVYDVGEDGGRPFIAMEYIEGNTLSGVIRSREDLTLDRKLALMEQLCDGLAYAHRAGIVHRDIKPANLMLDGRGTLKILDFGIARIGHAAATGMTQAGTLMGTLNYMSPEQMTGRPVDHRTDIFAVGAVVYEFLAYQRAFPGDIQDGVLHRIIHEPPPPLEKFVPGVDKAVLDIVAKSLEKDREQRYQDLDQMRQDIAKFRARELLKDEPAARQREITHDDRTIVRPSGSVIMPPTPGPVADPKKAELQRKKQKQIESLLDSARNALDSGDADSVFTACENVLMLDPDNMAAVELSERAQSMGEQAQLKTLLGDVRAYLAKNEVEKAQQIVGQALVIDPTSKDVLALRKEVDEAKKRKLQQDQIEQELRETVDRAKKAFSQQTYETAIQYADNALKIDARSAEAIDIKQKATALIEEKRAKAKAQADAEARARADAQSAAERQKQDEAARLAKGKAEADAALEARRQEEARVAKAKEEDRRREQEAKAAKAKADADAAEAQRQEQARVAKAQEDDRKRQDAERKKQQDEEARRVKAQQEARRAAALDVTQPMPAARREPQADPGTVNLPPAAVAKAVKQSSAAQVAVQAPAPVSTYDDIPAPAAVEKKGGVSAVVMGGVAAAVVVVGVVGYLMFGPKAPRPVTGEASAMTFTVNPWAHLEIAGKTDPSAKASCESTPCVVSLLPGVYNVRATNAAFRELDFDLTVEPGKPDNVFRSLEGFNAESEVNNLLAK